MPNPTISPERKKEIQMNRRIRNQKESFKRKIERSKENRINSFQRAQKNNPAYVKRDCLREIRFSNQKLNCVRYNLGKEGNSIRHEVVKALVCLELEKKGNDYISEAIFNNNKRADVIDLNEAVIYEILYSETEEEVKEKVKSYPDIFEIRTINSKLPFKAEMML